MTSLPDGAADLVTRGTEIGVRIDGLASAAAAARGRVDDAVVDEAETIAGRGAGRLRLSADHTVVAIAGATGSGKSSTFNALTGLELSSTGVRRPTTSWATACVWGKTGAEELLEWLGIPPRHQTMRDSLLDTSRDESVAGVADRELDGVVLMDLPDHDSTEVSHHLEVDRLVVLADLLVWVLDPQKYADAAIHDRYLAPLASHSGVMVVVLNHIDTVPEDRRQSMVDDVRRLLALDGLSTVPVFAVSARAGIGVDDLRHEIASRVAAKKLTRQRIEADLRTAAAALDEAGGGGAPRELSAKRVGELESALADAAGVPVVVDAVERSTRVRARRATTWPVVSLLGRLGPDPLAGLELDLGSSAEALSGGRGAALPSTAPVQRARVDSEVRALADDASAGLGPSWVEAVRRAATARLPEVGDRLDRALADTDLGVDRLPGWVGLVRVVQWLLLLVALAGGAWAVALLVGGTLDDAPQVAGVALPLLLLVAGVVLGIVLAVVCRFRVATAASDRAGDADESLREAVHGVATELVVAPVQSELAAYSTVRSGVAAALKD